MKQDKKRIDIKTEGLPLRSVKDFIALQGGLKAISEDRLTKLTTNITTNGFIAPIFIWKDQIVDGHQRLKALERLMANGYSLYYKNENVGDKIPYVVINAKSKQEAGRFILTYNSQYGQIVGLDDFLSSFKLNWDDIDGQLCLNEDFTKKFGKTTNKLKENWVMPPFSILDTRQEYWMTRRDEWKALLGNTTFTRENALGENVIASINEGVSLFDPVLAEILYKWFCPVGGRILNLFAGGVEPNIVAGYKGYDITGIELRQEQVDHANFTAVNLAVDKKVKMICDDALNVDKLVEDNGYDMVFSCPPYYDLEEYGSDPRDFANKTEVEFDKLLSEVIEKSIPKLKQNRFAVFVVSEVRDPKTGAYRGLVPKVINWFTKHGMQYYNEVILVNSIGTLPFRINKSWAYRKVGRMHQNILVFYKGKVDKIKDEFAKVDTDLEIEQLKNGV